jgi:hypothetical protein
MSWFVPLGVRLPQVGNHCLRAMIHLFHNLAFLSVDKRHPPDKQKSDRAKSGLFVGGGSRKVGKTFRKAPQNFAAVQRHRLNNQGFPAYLVRNKETLASSYVLSLR